MSGCLDAVSETVRDPTGDDERRRTVSPAPFTATATERSPVATFTGGAPSDAFGQSVATTGDTVFFGAPQAAPDGVDKAGVVAVIERTAGEWERTETLTGRTQPRDYFGGQLAASGSTLLVANEYDYSGTSRIPVSVFERSAATGWELTTELTEPVYVESMAVGGDTAVLRTGAGDGLAEVFERANGEWERRTTLSVDTRDDGRFSRAVATDGETILVGTPPKGGPKRRRAESGVVHVFERSGGSWAHRTTLSGAPGTDHFGWSVAVAGGTAVVGDYSNDTAYVVSRSDGQWTRNGMYTATEAASAQYFGDAVAVDGETVLVGAPHGRIGDSTGAVYSLVQPFGTDESRGRYFTAPDPAEQFGTRLATADGTTVVAGRRSDTGFVSVYER